MVDTVTVGVQSNADGTQPSLRGGRQGDLIVSHLHGRSYEQVSRGNVFSLGVTWTTGVAAGNITAAAAAASTQLALWNPSTNNKNVSILALMCGIVSGTIVGGPLIHNTFTTTVPSIASVGTAYNMLFGNTGTPSAKYCASAAGATLTSGTALLAVVPSVITYSAGTYAALAGSLATEYIDGRIVLAPGSGWVPCFAAAGTSVLGTWGVIWEEVPV